MAWMWPSQTAAHPPLAELSVATAVCIQSTRQIADQLEGSASIVQVLDPNLISWLCSDCRSWVDLCVCLRNGGLQCCSSCMRGMDDEPFALLPFGLPLSSHNLLSLMVQVIQVCSSISIWLLPLYICLYNTPVWLCQHCQRSLHYFKKRISLSANMQKCISRESMSPNVGEFAPLAACHRRPRRMVLCKPYKPYSYVLAKCAVHPCASLGPDALATMQLIDESGHGRILRLAMACSFQCISSATSSGPAGRFRQGRLWPHAEHCIASIRDTKKPWQCLQAGSIGQVAGHGAPDRPLCTACGDLQSPYRS